MKGNSLENVSKILSANGKRKIDEDGTLVAVRVITDELVAKKADIKEVRAEKLCLEDVYVTTITQLEELLKLVGTSASAPSTSISTYRNQNFINCDIYSVILQREQDECGILNYEMQLLLEACRRHTAE